MSMPDKMWGDILTQELQPYFLADINFLDSIPDAVKERIKIDIPDFQNVRVEVFSLDHNPPHFHIKNKDLSLDAKFLIKDGSFYEGLVNRNDMKRIMKLWDHPKGKMVMQKLWDVWEKKNGPVPPQKP